MAVYPCDFGSHRYASAQQTMYPALVNGSSAVRRKLRLCQAHFDRLHDRLTTSAQNAQVSFDEALDIRCVLCGEPVVDSEYQFFVTVYARGQEREDFWGPVHDDCAFSLADDWLLAPEAT